MPLFLGACISLLVISQTLRSVACLTNREFFDLVKDYAKDLRIKDNEDVMSRYDVKNDIIDLPGGPEDDLNFLYMFSRLGFSIKEVYPEKSQYVSQGDYGQLLGGCNCQGLTCSCCGSHTFRVNLVFKKYTFTLDGCVEVKYLTENKGFKVKLTINGHNLYNKEISLTNPPAICYGIPGFQGFARVCLKFYNVDIGAKRACAKLEGVLDFKVKKFTVDLELGCYSFSSAESDEDIRTKLAEMIWKQADEQLLSPYVEDDET